MAINDNEIADGDRTVELTLTEVTGGVRLGQVTKHTLKILDNEVRLQFRKTSFTNSEALPVAVQHTSAVAATLR